MKKAFAEGKSLFRTEARKIFLDKKAMVLYNILCVNRDVAQFGRALRSGHGTIQFISIEPNSHKPFNTATLRRLKKQNTCGQISFDHMLSHRHGNIEKIEYFISGCSAVW